MEKNFVFTLEEMKKLNLFTLFMALVSEKPKENISEEEIKKFLKEDSPKKDYLKSYSKKFMENHPIDKDKEEEMIQILSCILSAFCVEDYFTTAVVKKRDSYVSLDKNEFIDTTKYEVKNLEPFLDYYGNEEIYFEEEDGIPLIHYTTLDPHQTYLKKQERMMQENMDFDGKTMN